MSIEVLLSFLITDSYFTNYQQDTHLKYFTATLLFLNLLVTSTNFGATLNHFVYDVNIHNIVYLSKLFTVNFYLTPIVSFSVQMYFIYRLWVVSKSSILLVCTILLALLSLATGLVGPIIVSVIIDVMKIPRNTILLSLIITRVSDFLFRHSNLRHDL